MQHSTPSLRYRKAVLVLGTLDLAVVAYAIAFSLRFDLSIPEHYAPLVLLTLPLLVIAKLIAFHVCGVFGGSWRHFGMRDLKDIVRGNLVGSTLFLVAMVFFVGLASFPRAVFLLDLVLCTGLMAGARVAVHMWRERRARLGVQRVEHLALIVGAGSAGVRLREEIDGRPRLKLGVVGFVDDDESKVGLRVAGLPVLGRISDLPTLIAQHDVSEVLLAMPTAPGAVIRRVVEHCVTAGIRHRVLPTLGELVEGRVMYTQMRDVKVDDLLQRDPVALDLPRVRALVRDRTVLVTGAAGSIGSELCRQLATHQPRRLVLYDRHENGMFSLEIELRARFPEVELVPVLGDILLRDQLATVFAAEQPHLVFHAAAYKHVPLAERNVVEAVRNNVLGTRNVAEAAVAHGAEHFVLVSTDKAVRPTNVMGATKRLAEAVVQSLAGKGCKLMAVRFGNVLGSSGSVVPIFREQIARGGPVMVTHPDVTRYFMTIPEAAQLILQAASGGVGGEIFLLEMGEPVRIVDLARHMITLSGFDPDDDVRIEFSGLRPGEKMHEELIADEEEVASTGHDRIRVLRTASPIAPPAMWLSQFEKHVLNGKQPAAVKLLQRLCPGYTPSAFVLEQPAEVEPEAAVG
jgi:FlaA1/EpsC-like NDP-sugar epimerase